MSNKQFATAPIRRPLRGSLCCSRPDKQQQHDVRPSLLVVPVAAQSGSVTRCWFRVMGAADALLAIAVLADDAEWPPGPSQSLGNYLCGEPCPATPPSWLPRPRVRPGLRLPRCWGGGSHGRP